MARDHRRGRTIRGGRHRDRKPRIRHDRSAARNDGCEGRQRIDARRVRGSRVPPDRRLVTVSGSPDKTFRALPRGTRCTFARRPTMALPAADVIPRVDERCGCAQCFDDASAPTGTNRSPIDGQHDPPAFRAASLNSERESDSSAEFVDDVGVFFGVAPRFPGTTARLSARLRASGTPCS